MTSLANEAVPIKVQRLFAVVTIAGCLLFMVIGVFYNDTLLISLAAATQMMVLIPWLTVQDIDVFSTWSFVVLTVFIGVFLRSIYITLDIPSAEIIRSVFLLDYAKDFLLFPSVIILFGITLLTIGYVSGQSKPRELPLRLFKYPDWNEARFILVVLILLGISIWATDVYVTDNGGWAIANISRKRNIFRELEGYSAQGYLRWAMAAAFLALLLTVTRISSSKRLQIFHFFLLIPALALSLFGPFFTSNRSELISNIIIPFAIYYYLNKEGFKWRYSLATLFIGVIIFNLMTNLRAGRNYSGDLIPSFTQINAYLQPIVVNRNLIDAAKLAHIVNAIPESLDYEFGKTMITWTYAWIPRTIWPDKPIIGPGQLVAAAIYRPTGSAAAGGIPPGFLAELYWNFWFPGVVVGSFILGRCLRYIDAYVTSFSDNPNVVLLYASSFMLIGMQLLGGSLSQSAINFLTSFVPLYLILFMINNVPEKPRYSG